MNKTEPYFDEDGTLVIPFECTDHAYKYWKQEGKKMKDILTELGAPKEVWEKYTHEPFPEEGESQENEGSADE